MNRSLMIAVGVASLMMPMLTAKDAAAQVIVVKEVCKNAVCSKATYSNGRVNIRMRSLLTKTSHFNFKTNPGAQIEIGGTYSFARDRGDNGTYSAQACNRGGIAGSGVGGTSSCSRWATFKWSTGKAEEVVEEE